MVGPDSSDIMRTIDFLELKLFNHVMQVGSEEAVIHVLKICVIYGRA